jgi:hypothetical protein
MSLWHAIKCALMGVRGHGVRGHDMRGHGVRGHDLRGHGVEPSPGSTICYLVIDEVS